MLLPITRGLALLFAYLIISCPIFSQDCSSGELTNGSFLNANNVFGLFPANGSQLWDFEESQFGHYDGETTINTIFAQGLWMGGYNEADDLQINISRYGDAQGASDYLPGPLNIDGSLFEEACGNFDRSWTVSRAQIEYHIADFLDNDQIDNPLSAVIGWPGSGNTEFNEIFGFDLPDGTGPLAPFKDLNSNGIYEPLLGEYPVEPKHESIPGEMIWTVFNTLGDFGIELNDTQSLVAEVQCTAWGFSCQEEDLLNNTIFVSYAITNRGELAINDMRFGLWNDFDLGCLWDDLIGCSPDQNTFFAYNQDNVDEENCDFNITGAGVNPPVQSITYLNRNLDGFIYIANDFFGDWPDAVIDPTTAVEAYQFLNARFRDGSRINSGEIGYDPAGSEPTDFVFPGNPNVFGAWSSFGIVGPRDLRTIASTEIGFWPTGERTQLDLAYTYHRIPSLDHLQNLAVMYQRVPMVQSIYDNGFEEACLAFSCVDDCVWSGDLNADGIANHVDILALAYGFGENGGSRVGPYVWEPRVGVDWGEASIFDIDKKHLDANGDGLANRSDFSRTDFYYNNTTPDYEPTISYPQGPELSLVPVNSSIDLEELEPGRFVAANIIVETNQTELQAITFSLDYDPELYSTFINQGTTFADDLSEIKYARKEEEGILDFTYYERESLIPQNEEFRIFRIIFTIDQDLPAELDGAESLIRFRNIRGFLSDGTEVSLGAPTYTVIPNGPSAIAEPVWAQQITLAPNPVRDQLQLYTGSIQFDDLVLFDALGHVYRIRNNGNLLDLRELSAGTYYLRIIHKGKSIVRKIVKMN